MAPSRIELSSAVPTDVTDFGAGTTVSVYLLPAATGNSVSARRRRAESITASSAATLLSQLISNGTTQGFVNNGTLIDVEYVASNSGISQQFVNSTIATTVDPNGSGASTGGTSTSDEEKAICKL